MTPLLVGQDLEREYRFGPGAGAGAAGSEPGIHPAELVAVVGASGIGKSTLLHLLGTLDRPSAGRVLFEGEDVLARTEAGQARFAGRRSGFVFQFYNLLTRHDRARERDAPRAHPAPSAEEARERAAARSREVGLPIGPATGRASCPAESSSAWPSRERS